MWADLSELTSFYGTPAGTVARRAIRRRLRAIWPSVKGYQMLGLGYAGPYLGLFASEAARAVGVLPEGPLPNGGTVAWPRRAKNLLAQGQETRLPLQDRSFDRILLVHAIEGSEALRRFLREVWRVLADDGRVIVVAPHRRGVWARFEHTPFGHGRPFSVGQLTRLLTEQTFDVRHTERALFVPPAGSRFLLSTAGAWERAGRVLRPFGGVVIAEAEKKTLAGDAVPARRRRTSQTAPAATPVKRDPASSTAQDRESD